MSKYKIHALAEDTYWLQPEGDGYAPQVALTWGWHRVTEHTLNLEAAPNVDVMRLVEAYSHFGYDAQLTARWARIVWGYHVETLRSYGHSQGDVAEIFIFGSPEFYAVTGAPDITPEDGTDLGAWLWGDVFEVIDAHDTDNRFYVYGMDAALEYGEIIYPTYTTVVSWGD